MSCEMLRTTAVGDLDSIRANARFYAICQHSVKRCFRDRESGKCAVPQFVVSVVTQLQRKAGRIRRPISEGKLGDIIAVFYITFKSDFSYRKTFSRIRRESVSML